MDTLRDPWTEIRRLQASVLSLQTQLAQIHAQRPPATVLPQQVRWAVTCAAYGADYPSGNANAFPIKFLDAHFTATQGEQTFESSERNAEPAAIAFSKFGYVPINTPVPVFELRGLGSSTAGVWWILTSAATQYNIRFHIESADPLTRSVLGSILAWAPHTLTKADLPGQETIAGQVTICDPHGCIFNEPAGELLGRTGTATYRMPEIGQAAPCQVGPYVEPQWEADTLCCPTPACDEGA
jgi:hypothetical protein